MPDETTFTVDEEFRLIGRTFEEYRAMFGLDATELVDTRVLDCPGGPGAFTAVASAVGADVTAVDPAYGPPASDLGPVCDQAVTETVTQLHEKRDLFVWDFYGDVETRGRYLRAAYERFLTDYERHPNRYVEAALPDLPFPDDSFDLTLSANLLFLYDDRLSSEFHHAAVDELLRVTRGEVRLFPLASLDRERSVFVDRVVGRLREQDIETEFRPVDYEFQPGATEMLVLS
ncbi:hypothetical protein SAMN04487949_0457 [Halogranum gelatinilyticum]|uniref:Methyltransferase type 11 domain-containing protein n=1 Tax=Halogranum gelatinilyticum TaxID=660521 RepID=A0A1G9PP24_9EURY|nr:methyltransferase domain-containing protein [Halogranum gelatinilyticum]SDM00241.1 hypothetical protein SAMN04487949_0457 [Halogranum gelatinilyticum]